MSTYLRSTWKHPPPDMPVEILSELDPLRFETRKIEKFANGTFGYASASSSRGTTRLGLVALPPLSDIRSQPEFDAKDMTQDEFDAAWQAATKS